MSWKPPTKNAPRAHVTFGGEGVVLTPEDGEWICLYVLSRTDIGSMNRGKAVAQGAHAANMMSYLARRSNDPSLRAMLEAWEDQSEGQGFGTTITLSVNERQMRQAVGSCGHAGLHAGIVHDKTYPLRDGEVTHLIPLDTGGFVFGPRYLTEAVLHRLGLMP